MIATFSDGFNGRVIKDIQFGDTYICRGLWILEECDKHSTTIRIYVIAEKDDGSLCHIDMTKVYFTDEVN